MSQENRLIFLYGITIILTAYLGLFHSPSYSQTPSILQSPVVWICVRIQDLGGGKQHPRTDLFVHNTKCGKVIVNEVGVEAFRCEHSQLSQGCSLRAPPFISTPRRVRAAEQIQQSVCLLHPCSLCAAVHLSLRTQALCCLQWTDYVKRSRELGYPFTPEELTQEPCPQGKSLRHRRWISFSNTAESLPEDMPVKSMMCATLC